MQNKTYKIKYEIILIGSTIKDKEMNVKNCLTGVGAQIKLEGYLKKKYSNFKQLIVHSCVEDYLSTFGDMFGSGGFTAGGNPFGDIFGKK